MPYELVLVTASVAVTGLLVVAGWMRWRASQRGAATMFAVAWGLAFAVFVLLSLRHREPVEIVPQREDTPIELPADGFVSSDTCRSCHPDQHASWQASFHRTMTQHVEPGTVMGDFDDVELYWRDQRFFLSRDGDRYWVEMDDPEHESGEGEPARVRFEITMTTGSHHMQMYWFPSGESRKVGMLPFVYLKPEARWIPRNAAFIQPPSLRPERLFGRWNDTCINCHTTDPTPGISGEYGEETMVSRVAELGIACEACHGPGADHVREYRSPLARYGIGSASSDEESIVNPESLSHVRSSEVCGKCHSINNHLTDEDWELWKTNGFTYRPGEVLDDHVNVLSYTRLDEPVIQDMLADRPGLLERFFWADGMVRVSGREYNGLLETPCYVQGEMSCTSCHTLHKKTSDRREWSEWTDDQLSPRMRGNDACIGCHESYASEEALTRHTYHEAGSSGSSCYNCHMPHTTYGLLKAMRSHTVSSPSVEESAGRFGIGRPNACSLCHLDRPLAWTAEYLDEWYGIDVPEGLTDDEKNVAAAALWVLEGDAGQRALAAWSMGWEPAREVSGSRWMIPLYAQLFDDTYPAVPIVARRSWNEHEAFASVPLPDAGASTESGEARREALLRMWQLWRSLPRRDRDDVGAVLQNEDGSPDTESLRRLFRQREDPPVFLAE